MYILYMYFIYANKTVSNTNCTNRSHIPHCSTSQIKLFRI